MKIKASDFANLTSDGILYNGNCEITGIATDSGKVKKGDLFVCIKGERVDGHSFVSSAIENGAACVLSDRVLDITTPYIKVPDTVLYLQKAATAYRKTLNVKTVGVTGSVGKTTTKEFIYSALSEVLSVHKTDGNKNSETGVPITVFGISEKNEAAVVEMGMSGLGEISELSKIAMPDVSVITNIGFSHIEHLKTRENILKAKLEIIDGMDKDGVLILNGDDDMLASCRDVFPKVLFYSIKNKNADYYAYDITETEKSSKFTVKTLYGEDTVTINLPGEHNIKNALAAIAVGETLGLSLKDMKKGLSGYKPADNRQNIYKHKDVTIFNDCYNSAPNSLKASLDVLKKMNGRKIAVLGDMLELGEMSAVLHEKSGEELSGISTVYLYGNYAPDFAKGAYTAGLSEKDVLIFPDKESLAKELIKNTKPGDVILFKASNSMRADKIAEEFIKNYRR